MTSYCIYFDRYNHMSGGIRALHVLKDELVARGHDAFMSYERKFIGDDVVVYPEVVRDNPLGAKKVVRWLLNTATGLPDDGLRYAWVPGISDDPLLTVNILEPELWKPYDGPREGVAYWVGKGRLDESQLPPGMCVPITRDNFPERAELAEFISRLDYLISFDPFTAVVQEAVNCGTPVVILASDTHQAAIGHYNSPLYGVAWGWDEMDHARSTVHLAWQDYEDQKRVFKRRIRNFIRDTEKM